MSGQKLGFWQGRIVGKAQNFSGIRTEVFRDASLRQFGLQSR